MNARVVLVIEDNPTTRKIVRLTLGNEGFTVIEAGDGAEGLALASKTPPDLILQDLLLPDMDGIVLVGRLRALPELAGVPIIACSGFLSRLEHGRAAGMGFTDFLPKPVEPSRLVQVVRAHLPPDVVVPEKIGAGQRVLVVDDDPVQLKVARIRLMGLGFEVATATDGTEALDVLQRGGTQMVVSDVLMPRLDGFGLCAAMRKDPRLSHVPLILVSSNYVEDADQRLAHRMGATAFVVRTPDLAGVIQALTAAMNLPSVPRVPSVHPDPAEHHQHHERILRQLERQAALNAAFAHQLAMHASMLSVVAGISESLAKRHSLERAAPDILASLLDASGVSMGALFVSDPRAGGPGATALDDLVLRAQQGLPAGVADDARTFFGHRALFERAVTQKAPLVVGSTIESSLEHNLLALGGMASALIVPCVADDECLAVVLLASKARDLTETDWIPFARMIAVHLGLSFSLSRSFSRLEHEILERAQAESNVRHQRDRAQRYLDTAEVILLKLDLEGRIALVNRYGSSVLGWTADELLGRDWFDTCVPVRIRNASRAKFHDLLGQERSFAESPILTMGGEERLIEWRNRLLRDDEGCVIGTFSSGADITERKRAEEEIRDRATVSALGAAVGLALTEADSLPHALQQCAESLVTHLRAAFARIWTLNERNGVLELQASAGLYTHLNGPHAKVPVGQFKIGRIALNRKAHLTNAVIGDPEVGDQEWARREGMEAFAGHPLIVDDRVVGVIALFARHPLSDAVISALASVADHVALGIERHRSAERLRTAEERMRFALQNADVGIWDMDCTTGAVRWSEIIEAHYGLQPGTFGGTFEAFVERIHPDDRAVVLETVGKAMTAGGDFSVLNRSIQPDGLVRWLYGTGRILLGEHGEPVRAVGISQDVTERKRAEIEFKRLNEEIQLQRMRVFRATMTTVQDIVNNLLNGFLLVRLEGEAHIPAETLTMIDRLIEEASVKLKSLGNLESLKEKEMAIGVPGIEYPTAAF